MSNENKKKHIHIDPLDIFLKNRLIEHVYNDKEDIKNNDNVSNVNKDFLFQSYPGTKKIRSCISAYIKMSEILARVAGMRTVTSALYDVSFISTKTIRAIGAYYEIPVDVLGRRNIVKMLLDVLFYTPQVMLPNAHARIYASDVNYEQQAIDKNNSTGHDDDDDDSVNHSVMSDLITNLSVYKNTSYSSLENHNVENVKDALGADMDYSYDPRPRAHQRFVHGNNSTSITSSDYLSRSTSLVSRATLRWSDTLHAHANNLIQHEAVSFFTSMLSLIATEDSILLSPNSKVQAIRRMNRLYSTCGASNVFNVDTLQKLHYDMTSRRDRSHSRKTLLKTLGFN